jgi:hypothetical protein
MCQQGQLSYDRLHLMLPAEYELEFFDTERSYPEHTVFYYDMYGPWQEHISQQLDRGQRVIFDAKSEHYIFYHMHSVLIDFLQHPNQGCFIISGHAPIQLPGVKIIATPYWYWILDQGVFARFDYQNYVPAPTKQYKFFMQIGLDRPDRDVLYKKFQPVLHDSMHSYRSRGVFLPNDYTEHGWQRYINFDWINQTCFTVSAETYIADNTYPGFSLTTNNNWFLSEKSYKAIATHHPFLLASTQGNLAYLRDQGFETFPELWDESYDTEPNFERRLDLLVGIIQQFDQVNWNQNIVQEKLQHNRARFFDRELTKKFWMETIVEPVLEFAQ